MLHNRTFNVPKTINEDLLYFAKFPIKAYCILQPLSCLYCSPTIGLPLFGVCDGRTDERTNGSFRILDID